LLLLEADRAWGTRLFSGKRMWAEGGRMEVTNAGVLEEAVGSVVSEVVRGTLVAIIVGV